VHDNEIFIFGVEGLLAGYYLFVAESISKRSIIPLAIGISLCLLSRYSIIFWVPLCVLLCFVAANRKNALIICLTVLLFFVAFYWFPFLRKDASIFMKGYAYHTNAAYYEWLRDLNVYGGKVYLFNGLGFTAYAMKFVSGDLHFKLAFYKTLHLSLCILTVSGLGWYYIRSRQRYPLRVFLLFSFKVYLAVFYAFIQIPYKYLYFVPIIVSASLLGAAFRRNSVNETANLAATDPGDDTRAK
jgi:hypothetical protein